MSTHLSAQQVEQYSKRQLAPEELLDAGDHLVVCEACRLKLSNVEQLDNSLSVLREDFRAEARRSPEHLTYEQLSGYVDDHLDEVEREIVDSHAVVCAPCKEELRDLFAFKDGLSNAAAVSVSKDKTPIGATVREKLTLRRRARWQMAGAVAALILVSLIVWLALRTKRDAQIAELQPTPSPAVSPALSPLPSPTPTPGPSVNSNGVTSTPTPATSPAPSPSSREVQPVENPQAAPLLALKDNSGQITLDNQGNLSGLEAVTAAERRAIRRTLQSGRLETPAVLSDLRGRSGTLMSDSSDEQSFAVISPAATVVQTDRPRFRWQALAGASAYTVKIYDANFTLVDSSAALKGNEWTPDKALPSGKVYQWQVTAVKDGVEIVSPAPPAPEARFRVLGRTEAAELTRSISTGPNSHLARGVIYTRAGLLDEAEREFQALLGLNPQSRLARQLLESVRRARRAP
jgi:hypothetical protein